MQVTQTQGPQIKNSRLDFKALKKTAMIVLRDKLVQRLLSKEQIKEVKTLILDTDKMVAKDILRLLGLDTEGLSKEEMVEMVAEKKKAGGFSSTQETQIGKLETELQVIVLQGLIEILMLTPQDLGLGKLQFADIERELKIIIWKRVMRT